MHDVLELRILYILIWPVPCVLCALPLATVATTIDSSRVLQVPFSRLRTSVASCQHPSDPTSIISPSSSTLLIACLVTKPIKILNMR